MREIAPNRGPETKGLGVDYNEDGRAAGTDAGDEVHEAAAEDDELRIRKKPSAGAPQSSAKHRRVRW